jgi:restriction system protein
VVGAACAAGLWLYPVLHHPSGATVDLGAAIAPIIRQLSLPVFIAFGILALAVYYGQGKRRRLLQQQESLDSLRALSWQDFERLVGQVFRGQGYQVIEQGDGGADGGIDLELRKDHARVLVQCKQWRQQRVGVKTIRELYGVLQHERAARALCVTCGTFTTDAQAFAAGKPLQLIDGPQLLQRIAEGESGAPAASLSPVPPAPAAPSCPKCGQAMVVRTARRGEKIGRQFFGCTSYPQCRGMREKAKT